MQSQVTSCGGGFPFGCSVRQEEAGVVTDGGDQAVSWVDGGGGVSASSGQVVGRFGLCETLGGLGLLVWRTGDLRELRKGKGVKEYIKCINKALPKRIKGLGQDFQ